MAQAAEALGRVGLGGTADGAPPATPVAGRAARADWFWALVSGEDLDGASCPRTSWPSMD